LNQAKTEVVDSIFFHASELNQIVYNFSWKSYKETHKEEKKKDDSAQKEKPVLGHI